MLTTQNLIYLINSLLFGKTPETESEGPEADADEAPPETEPEDESDEIDESEDADEAEETFPRSYVEKLRAENKKRREELAGLRKTMKETNARLDSITKKSEAEKKAEERAKLEKEEALAQELDDAKKELENAQAELERTRQEMLHTKNLQLVTKVAGSLDFIDPSDAVNMLSSNEIDDLSDESGIFDEEIVKDKLKEILDRKPYLGRPKDGATIKATNEASKKEKKPFDKGASDDIDEQEEKLTTEIREAMQKNNPGEAFKKWYELNMGLRKAKHDRGNPGKPFIAK